MRKKVKHLKIFIGITFKNLSKIFQNLDCNSIDFIEIFDVCSQHAFREIMKVRRQLYISKIYLSKNI